MIDQWSGRSNEVTASAVGATMGTRLQPMDCEGGMQDGGSRRQLRRRHVGPERGMACLEGQPAGPTVIRLGEKTKAVQHRCTRQRDRWGNLPGTAGRTRSWKQGRNPRTRRELEWTKIHRPVASRHLRNRSTHHTHMPDASRSVCVQISSTCNLLPS